MQPQPDQLRSIVRRLGRVLGDVIRAEDGDAVFDQIEEIRKVSVGLHRDGAQEAARSLTDRLGTLSLSDSFHSRLRLFPADHQYRGGPAPA